MNRLFVIRNYETDEPLSYYLTDNPYACHDILYDIDCNREEYTESEIDHWENTFVKRCQEEGIKLKRITEEVSYTRQIQDSDPASSLFYIARLTPFPEIQCDIMISSTGCLTYLRKWIMI